METLVDFSRLEIGFLLASLMFIVVYQILTGKINANGMLVDGETGNFSPGRVQLLVFTLVGALYYILQARRNPGHLPEIPQELLLILGGSQIVYLGGKAFVEGG